MACECDVLAYYFSLPIWQGQAIGDVASNPLGHGTDYLLKVTMAALVIAHIGKIPVEEYAGFIVPVIALYAYGQAWSRRHRKKVAHLPDPAAPLDERTIEFVAARWAAAKHGEVGREQLPLMYPPGPDGITASELAERIGADPFSVTRRLEDLADLGYVEFDPGEDGQRFWLTVEGIDLLNITEEALLAVFDDFAAPPEEPASTG